MTVIAQFSLTAFGGMAILQCLVLIVPPAGDITPVVGWKKSSSSPKKYQLFI